MQKNKRENKDKNPEALELIEKLLAGNNKETKDILDKIVSDKIEAKMRKARAGKTVPRKN